MKWSTVRTLGGHGSNPRLSCFLRPRFIRTHVDATVPLAELDNPLAFSSFTQFAPTGPQVALRSCSTNLHDHSTGARARTNDAAIDTLRLCLSPDNATSDRPVIYSSTIIRSLYYSVESRNQLDLLDSKMLTLLIGLFGSLSVDTQSFHKYTVPLASSLLAVSTRRTHWPFILKVGKHKLERGMPLHDSDRFWLMRAELAVVRAGSPSEPLSSDVYSAVLRARAHYHAIRRHSCHPEVHAHYLESLLKLRDHRLLDLASRDFSFLLRTHDVCHTRLQRLLFCLVTQHGGSLSLRSQEAILTAFWSRICRKIDTTAGFASEIGISDISLGGLNSDVTTIARTISAGLFGSVPKDKSVIMPVNLLSVFCPKYALSLRWSSLTSFSVFNSLGTIRLDATNWTSNHGIPKVASCWQIIFGLATVERILQKPSAFETQANGDVLRTAHSLYQQWLPIIKSSQISPELAYAVATSFLRITNILADATFFHNCQDLYRAKKGTQVTAPIPFAAQYIAAAVRVQGLLPDMVLEALAAFSPDIEQQHLILASAVEGIAPFDASLANKLYTFAQANGMESDLRVARTLAMSFAQSGALRQVVLFLDDSKFSPETRGILLSVIARSLRENRRIRHCSQSAFVAVAGELVALYRSHAPPEHFRGHLEQLFTILARHGRGSQLFPSVLSIFRRAPHFFQPRFFDRYCRALIRHRQIFTANQLLGAITTEHPKIVRYLRILADRTAVRTKTSRVFKRAIVRSPGSLRLSSRLRRCPDVGLPLECSLQELLKSGRVLAAKRTFTHLAAAIPLKRRTALGNILIHGVALQPKSRNGRRVCKVLALLENLVQNHDFRPDRVTANILIKVMLSWRSAFNSPRLRDLFDQLVRAGYPAAEYSALYPPFGTRQTQSLGPSSLSKLPPFVSFEKHMRPLFKMFIKAFYSCNDVEAARKVVGILKVEEHKDILMKEGRLRARSRGRVKAAQRNMTPLDTIVP